MGIHISLDTETGPEIEEEILLKHLIVRGEEAIWNNPPAPRSFWWTLVEIVTAQDGNCQDRVKMIRERSSRMMLVETLLLLKGALEKPPEQVALSERESSADRLSVESIGYQQVLRYVWKEGRKQLDSSDFSFLRIWAFLGWIGLQCFPARLEEFEEIIRSDRPERELLEVGHCLIREALFSGDDSGVIGP